MLLVEFYQLFEGLEVDVFIDKELTALVLPDVIVVHLAMMAVKSNTRIQTNNIKAQTARIKSH